MTNRAAPHNPEAERAYLGSILVDPEVVIYNELTAEHFYSEANRLVMKAILELFERNSAIDLVTVTEELRVKGALEAVGGIPYLIGLGDSLTTAAYADDYQSIIAEKYAQRQLISTSGQLMQAAYDGKEAGVIVDLAMNELAKVQGRNRADFTPIGDIAPDLMDVLELRASPERSEVYTSSGWNSLDEMFTGFEGGKLYVWAARPAMGKTAAALNTALHIATREKKTVAIYSLEMSQGQLTERMIASEARIDANRLKHPKNLGERDYQRLADTIARISEAPIFINDDSSMTMPKLRASATRLHQKHGLSFIVVDYLQLMEGVGMNRQEEIARISRGLKTLARELNIPILVLAQLSRAVESRPNKRPVLSDLRESGAIEQDADLVMFLYRDEYYDKNSEKAGIAEFIIAKQRSGSVGTVELQFHPQHVRFNDLAQVRS